MGSDRHGGHRATPPASGGGRAVSVAPRERNPGKGRDQGKGGHVRPAGSGRRRVGGTAPWYSARARPPGRRRRLTPCGAPARATATRCGGMAAAPAAIATWRSGAIRRRPRVPCTHSPRAWPPPRAWCSRTSARPSCASRHPATRVCLTAPRTPNTPCANGNGGCAGPRGRVTPGGSRPPTTRSPPTTARTATVGPPPPLARPAPTAAPPGGRAPTGRDGRPDDARRPRRAS